MSIKSIIVAVDRNKAIGQNNNLLCYLPNDLKYFKTVTNGHTVIMGRKTFESLPKGALPNRRNIVITRNKNMVFPGCETCHNIDEAFGLCENENEVFIMGGASVYNETIDLADKLYLTIIDHVFDEADVFFSNLDLTKWKEISRTENPKDEKNMYNHTFIVYQRIQ
ncbi:MULTISPECIES: dihydrofolate reductase [unclassified Dysgonomonas]|uniref:dihydrofolate reductase n=1 Tax=unclassified Dysgonomonas TaxID=2630389 RepID=UPI0024734BA0|nr:MULTISPECIES: dihydrofolate reductase [unclassified Dysgonomonas]